MNPPENMTEVIDRKRYDVKKSVLLAGNDYWDGHNWERSGTQRFLYKTLNGRYFEVNLTQWQGEQDSITPLSEDEAYDSFESLSEKRVSFAEAFPNVKIEDA